MGARGNARQDHGPAPREWSQLPQTRDEWAEYFEKKRPANAACPSCEYMTLVVAWLVLLLLSSNGIWLVLELVRRGILD